MSKSSNLCHQPLGLFISGLTDSCSFDLISVIARSCGFSLRLVMSLDDCRDLAGVILLKSFDSRHAPLLLNSVPSIQIVLTECSDTKAVIEFSLSSYSPTPFRGKRIVSLAATPEQSVASPGEIVASTDHGPVWTTSIENGVRHDTYCAPLPWIKIGDCVFDHLNGGKFLNLLPMLEWMRWISHWSAWQHPPLRACFMFDDPNLHAPRYGFVDFQQLASAGRRHHYHTSFAMVPLDGYYVNPTAARIFRENPGEISLLIHGNNHTRRELARPQSPPEKLALMQQALHRIRLVEKKSGLSIPKVMAPPHGICSADTMAAMADAGFEAVCVSHGSVRTGNPTADWTVALGTSPAMVVASLPVIPRFGMCPAPENQILLAAYLNQPIIPVGHHWDLAQGAEILSSMAKFINGLGVVQWGNMADIARSNFRYRIEGHVMRLHMVSRAVSVVIPADLTELRVEAPWLNPEAEKIECQMPNGQILQPLNDTGSNFLLNHGHGNQLRVSIVRKKEVVRNSPHPRTPPRVFARKVLVELRDRIMPFMPKRLQRH